MLTFVAGELKFRYRIVYFNAVQCPPGLMLEYGDPLRKIFFDLDNKPCFVQYRLRKFNQVKPPLLLRVATTR